MSNIKINTFILCGGLGTRISKVEKNIPKCYIKISGKPFISHIIDQIKNNLNGKIVLCTGYKGEYYEEFKKNKNIHISHEKTQLGTGGAILNVEKKYITDNIFILNGDSYCEFDLKGMLEFHIEKKADVTILFSIDKERCDAGNLNIDNIGNIIEFNEKLQTKNNNYINAGVYLVNKNKLINEYAARNKSISLEHDLIPKWVKRDKVCGYKSIGIVLDIGTPERLKFARKFFKK